MVTAIITGTCHNQLSRLVHLVFSIQHPPIGIAFVGMLRWGIKNPDIATLQAANVVKPFTQPGGLG